MSTAAADVNPPLLSQPPHLDDNDDFFTVDDLPYLDANSFSHAELLSLCRTSKSYFDPNREDDVVIPVINRSIFNESAGSRRQTFARVRLRHSQHRPPRGDEIDGVVEKKRKLGVEGKDKIGIMGNVEGMGLERVNEKGEMGNWEGFGLERVNKKGKMGNEEVMGLKRVNEKDQMGMVGNEERMRLDRVNNEESVEFDCLENKGEMGIGKIAGIKGKGEVEMMGNEEGMGLEKVNKKGEMIYFNCLERNGEIGIAKNVVADKKRKLGVKRKGKIGIMENGEMMRLERVNKKGEIVDFDCLERNGDGLFEEELKRRIFGLEKEEEVLEYLGKLKGRWCNWRKKRRFVDASEFGDVLPIGWDLILGVAKNDGFFYLVCFKCVSPSGQQFESCKDVALFLRSYFVRNDAEHPMSVGDFSMTYDMASPSNDVLSPMTANVEANNLVDVKVKYGRPLSEGVITRDGKYECQFCHKIFEERRKYNGHLGVHARKGYNQSHKQVDPALTFGTVNDPIDVNKKSSLKMKVEFADRIASNSYMTSSSNVISNVTSQQLKVGSNDIEPMHHSVNASIDIDKRSSVKMNVKFADKASGNSYMTSSSNAFANVTSQQLKLGSNEIEPINPIVGAKLEGDLDQGLTHHDLKSRIESGEVAISEYSNAKSVKKFASPETDEMKFELSEHNVGYAQKASESPDAVHAIAQPHVLPNEIATSSELFMQSFEFLPDFTSGPEKGDYDFFKPDSKYPNVTGFDELGLDDLESLGYSFPEGQNSATLPGTSFDLANDSEMKKGNPVRFDSEVGISDMDGGHLLTTSCVWCQSEFQIQTNRLEPQSDAIGYMCPTCKDNIPGLS